MNLKYFPHFMRKNYPEVANESNEDLIEIGVEFKKYLQDIFKDKPEKLETIWNIDPMKVIMNMDHPLKVNGYDPVLVFHFGLFVEKMIKEEQEN